MRLRPTSGLQMQQCRWMTKYDQVGWGNITPYIMTASDERPRLMRMLLMLPSNMYDCSKALVLQQGTGIGSACTLDSRKCYVASLNWLQPQLDGCQGLSSPSVADVCSLHPDFLLT